MKINKQFNGSDVTIQLFIDDARRSVPNGDSGEQYIQKVSAHVEGQQVFEMNGGVSFSHNPYIEMHLIDRSHGDVVEVQWVDSMGDSGEDTVIL